MMTYRFTTAVGLACATTVLLLGAAPTARMADSPVADAAMGGDVAAVRTLLQHGADVNAAEGDGMTALHWAAEHGDHELAKLLLEAGANPRAETRVGRHTPLHVAARGGHERVVRLLVNAKADVGALTTTGAAPRRSAAAHARPMAVVNR